MTTAFVHNYFSDSIVDVTTEEVNEHFNSFDCEITLEDIKQKIAYFTSDEYTEDPVVRQRIMHLDPARVIVFHFDSEFDLYILT